ncbi:hypothetical protein Taro_016813, partial [Colocasia esculenta]|nr:hypothetical protein [Colocasia esculenta]
MLRWCRLHHVWDVLVVPGARRRWSFQREVPDGSALLVEVRLLNNGRAHAGWRIRGPFWVSGSVGGDRENWVLGVGRGDFDSIQIARRHTPAVQDPVFLWIKEKVLKKEVRKSKTIIMLMELEEELDDKEKP